MPVQRDFVVYYFEVGFVNGEDGKVVCTCCDVT